MVCLTQANRFFGAILPQNTKHSCQFYLILEKRTLIMARAFWKLRQKRTPFWFENKRLITCYLTVIKNFVLFWTIATKHAFIFSFNFFIRFKAQFLSTKKYLLLPNGKYRSNHKQNIKKRDRLSFDVSAYFAYKYGGFQY